MCLSQLSTFDAEANSLVVKATEQSSNPIITVLGIILRCWKACVQRGQVVLQIALLSFLLLSPYTGVPDPHQAVSQRTENRPQCDIPGCNFYAHCIESILPCGPQGFILSYAQRRCNIISRLRSPQHLSREAYVWAHYTETCFRSKLKQLLESYQTDSHPDPQTCLQWENAAIEEMNKCYMDKSRGADVVRLANEDISRLVSYFRVGGAYYHPAVDTGLVQLLHTIMPTFATTLLSNQTLSTRYRRILCVSGTKYNDLGDSPIQPSPEDFVTVVRDNIGTRADDSFIYAGPDMLEDQSEPGLCHTHSPSSASYTTTGYHLVVWFTADNSLTDIVGHRRITHHSEGLIVNGIYFELTTTDANTSKPSRNRTNCGDGKRQLTEYCDVAGNYPGCTIDCRVQDGYDCTIDKHAHSHCWREVCGNGQRTKNEECDDGNSKDGDGCSSTCKIEKSTHTCSLHYNMTSECSPHTTVQKQRRAAPAKLSAIIERNVDFSSAGSRSLPICSSAVILVLWTLMASWCLSVLSLR